MTVQKEILQAIRKADDAFDKLFSREIPFSVHLSKQHDHKLPDMYDHNAFVVNGTPSVAELADAEAFQKANGNDFFKIDSKEALSPEILESFRLEEDKTDTMLLEKGHCHTWKRNARVIIKNSKTDDINEDILSVELQNYGEDFGEDFVRRKMARYLTMAKKTPNFYYFGAYIDGKIAGACYAFDSHGYVCIDGLAVNGPFRKQYVATTLLAHIADTFGERLYLHADAGDTPKEMYLRMGFRPIDTTFEYNYQD